MEKQEFTCARSQGDGAAQIACARTVRQVVPLVQQVTVLSRGGRIEALAVDVEADRGWLALGDGSDLPLGTIDVRTVETALVDQVLVASRVIDFTGVHETMRALARNKDGGRKSLTASGYDVTVSLSPHAGSVEASRGDTTGTDSLPDALGKASPSDLQQVAERAGLHCRRQPTVLACRRGALALSAQLGSAAGGLRSVTVEGPPARGGAPKTRMRGLAQDVAAMVAGLSAGGRPAVRSELRSEVGSCFDSSPQVIPAPGSRFVCSADLDGTVRAPEVTKFRFEIGPLQR